MSWTDTPTRIVDVDGVPFAYRELGPDTGVPVVFLHHLMAVLDDWDPAVIDRIAATRHVVAFDNRGVGRSGGKVPADIEVMGRDAIAFIRAMGFEQVDLFGFSMGGAVAQMVALQAPQLVRRMVLAGTGPRGGGGIDEITKVAVGAFVKAALTLSDQRNFLFFPRACRKARCQGLLRAPQAANHRSRQAHLAPSPTGAAESHPGGGVERPR